LAIRELTVWEYVRYLNEASRPAPTGMPQVAASQGRARPRAGAATQPVTHVSFDEARAYCRWRSEQSGRVTRLPTEAEWEYAARGGVRQARYPWGWGSPVGRACFAANRPGAFGRYPPNPYGLYDMAGNVYEWCLPEPGAADTNRCVARGGSWAERDPGMLTVFTRAWFDRDYRNADVGFRVLVEVPRDEPVGTGS
jgi:formylglycine-generating enzyme required for sulfatase activity